MKHLFLIFIFITIASCLKTEGVPVIKQKTYEGLKFEKFSMWSKTYRDGPVFLKEWDYYGEIKDKLKLNEEPVKERGLFASGDIKEGTDMVNLPYTNIFSIDLLLVELNQLNDQIKHLNLTEEDVLALGLLLYKFCMESESYSLKYWIKALPIQYNNALYFDEPVLDRLKGSPGYVHAMMERSDAQELYKTLESTFFKSRYIREKCKPKSKSTSTSTSPDDNEPIISWEQFRWAVSTVTTRKIYSMNPEDDQLTVIVPPVFDFINYNYDPSAYFELTNSGGNLKLIASRDIKKGEQITLAYSSQDCNSDLFIDYGFVDFNSNALGCVNILYDELLETIKEDDPKRLEKVDILNKFMFSQDQLPRLKLFRESMTEDLLKISKYLSYKSSSLIPYLRSLIDLKLSHYPTSLVEDQRFLDTNEYKDLPYTEKLAFHVSYMEKSILSDTDKHLEKQIQNNEQQENSVPPSSNTNQKDEL